MQMKELKVDQDDVPVVSVDLSFAELSVLFAAVADENFVFEVYESLSKDHSFFANLNFPLFLGSSPTMTKEKFERVVRMAIQVFGRTLESEWHKYKV